MCRIPNNLRAQVQRFIHSLKEKILIFRLPNTTFDCTPDMRSNFYSLLQPNTLYNAKLN